MANRCRPVPRLLASAAVGAVLLILVPVGEAGTVPSVCPHSPHVWTHGPWTMLDRPEGLGKLRGAAVDTDRPETIYVTDGRRIARSMSGGCAWQIVLDLTKRGATDPLVGAEITSVVVPQGRLGRVYATVDTAGPLPGVSNEAVLASFDQGASWQTARGLPALRPSRLRASPADPNVMYLSMHTGETGPVTVAGNSIQVGGIWSFHASTDGGRSWTQRSTGQHRGRFVPDPADPNGVWALGSETSAFEGPYRSADGGRTWVTTASPPTDDVDRAEIDVYRTAGGAAQIVIAHDGRSPVNAPSLYLSPDVGRTFRKLPTDGLAGALWSVAFGRSERHIVVSTDLGVYRFNSQLKVWFDIDSQHLAPLRDATRIRGAQKSWSFWRPELVALYREIRPPKALLADETIPPPPVVCAPSHGFAPVERPRLPSATLEALDDPLDLEPSVPSRADFRLSLPAVPTALDTYFLLDTSASMKGAIDGIVCGLEQLVNGLAHAGVDAHFGLGEFQDAEGLRYRRVVDIGPPGYELQNSLRGRNLEGGEEPHRGALYQAATGAGLRTPTGDVLIPPRQNATYRPEAMRVVLLVTDEPYEATTTYEPTVWQVIDALRSRGVHHVGIHVRSADPLARDSVGDDAQTRLQLEEFSRGTRTFAPDGGVDCDGDGSVDVAPGAPLVCSVDREGIETNLAETLSALLLAARENGAASLRPVRNAGMHVKATGTQTIDVHDDYTGRHALPLSAYVTCTEEQAGTRHTLVMAADVSGREVARVPFGVRCGEPRAATEDGRPPTTVAAAPPAAAPAPVPAIEPSLSSSISSATAANPATGQAVGLQGEMHGASAAALAPDEREPGVELSSLNFTDAATAARVLGAGVLFGGFVIFERRRRTARRAFSTVRR